MDQQIRVLVVDDDEPHAEAVAESLERVGYECVIATSGRDGLRIIEEQTFDIVLTDLAMPHLTGLDLARQIRAQYPTVRVLLLTVADDGPTIREALQQGVAGYISKKAGKDEIDDVEEAAPCHVYRERDIRIRLRTARVDLFVSIDRHFVDVPLLILWRVVNSL